MYSHWCFTSFRSETFEIQDERVRYCVYQLEKCPDTDRQHWQGYIEFFRTVKMGTVKVVLNDDKVHCEPRKGTREEARAYCMKPESQIAEPVEYGVWLPDLKAGQRTDLAAARQLIQGKRKLADCYEDPMLDAVTTKYPKWVEKVHSLRPRDYPVTDIELFDWERQVIHLLHQGVQHRRIIWIVSPPKGGKTTFMSYLSTKWDVLPAKHRLWDVLSSYDDDEIIWFNVTKAQSRSMEAEFYSTLEEVSDIGWKLSTKGWPVIKKFVKAHIIVTCNQEPDEEQIPDRVVLVDARPLWVG